MSDRRLTPDPALAKLAEPARIIAPVTDLCRAQGGPRDRQLIYGDAVTVLARQEGWAYVQSDKDGYCGHLHAAALGAAQLPTHHVIAPATHAYRSADFKSPETASLSFGSQVTVIRDDGRYGETELGHIPLVHLWPMAQRHSDPAAVAALFLGTPYLWGGNSRWGIDCSGLVQAALLACGMPCPGDSDMQESIGQPTNEGYQRNDLLFWKGHVALVSDPETILHANASAMSTVYEPLQAAIDRIEAQGDGPVTAHRRL